jgi:hypothetical protein
MNDEASEKSEAFFYKITFMVNCSLFIVMYNPTP